MKELLRLMALLIGFSGGVSTVFGQSEKHEAEAIQAVEKLKGQASVVDTLKSEARVHVQLKQTYDPTLQKLAKLTAIGSLAIEDASKTTDTGYSALKELPHLQKLLLTKATITEKSAISIGSIKSLEVLYLGESKFTDAGMPGLKKLSELRSLDLFDTQITDRGLVNLVGLTKLEELNLSGTKITDKSLDQLKELKSLKLLRIVRTNITRAGLTKLEEALPNTTIRW